MARTFNCGVGMLIYTTDERAADALALLRDAGIADASVAGRIVERGDGDAVRLAGLGRWEN